MRSLATTFQSLVNPTPSLEGGGSTPKVEREFVVYGKLVYPDGLKQFKHVFQEQWETREGKIPETDVETSVRLRKESYDDGTCLYTHCEKVRQKGVEGCKETEREATAEEFYAAKEKAQTGCYKQRYKFPAVYEGNDVTWELDVFYTEDGEQVEWVKWDLEVPYFNGTLPPLPLECTDIFDTPVTKRTEEQHQYCREVIQKDMFINRT